MDCFKNKDGINIPVVMVIADLLREKGYDISDNSGCYIQTLASYDSKESIGVLIKDPRPPKKRFFGLILEQQPSMFLGYFKVKSLKKIDFYVFGKDNVGLAQKLSLDLVEYIKNFSKESIEDLKIEIFLKSENVKYEYHQLPDYD